MYQFATVCQDVPELLLKLRGIPMKDQLGEYSRTSYVRVPGTGGERDWREVSPPGGAIQATRPRYSPTSIGGSVVNYPTLIPGRTPSVTSHGAP